MRRQDSPLSVDLMFEIVDHSIPVFPLEKAKQPPVLEEVHIDDNQSSGEQQPNIPVASQKHREILDAHKQSGKKEYEHE